MRAARTVASTANASSQASGQEPPLAPEQTATQATSQTPLQETSQEAAASPDKSDNSVGRNSMIMASGTAASRVTGQIRTILLAAAIGTTGIAADAYQTGAMIPQVMFTLISGGIFNAVLVPQIVRTLKEEDAEDRLNKLITASVALLAGLTLVLMLGTSVLTSIYLNSKWNPAQRALANAFTLWCMPQVFFYGLYTVLGQILAAKGRFTAYAWSSVGANVISCAGFVVFIAMFGNAQKQPMDFWSGGKVGLTAGAWTLGVAFQALVLFIPLIRSGFTYRPRFGLKGIGLRSMGPVAAWSLGVVVIDQLANIVNARITNGAPLEGNPFDIAGNGSYQNAYTLYMLPYSLIAVSVSTAIFPQLSQAIAADRISDARQALSRALRNVGLLMCFFGVVMLVIPVPIIRALLPSVNVHEAVLISGPLLGLTVGLAAVSAFLLIQRTFYAFEDGKQPFIFAAISNALQVVLVLLAVRLAPPQYWTALVGLSMALSNILSFPLLVHMLKQRFEGSLDGRRIGATYAKAIVAAAISGALALAVKNPLTHLVGAQVSERHGHMSWLQAVLICVLITLVVSLVYCLVLYALHTQELIDILSALADRFGLAQLSAKLGHRTGAILPAATEAAEAEIQAGALANPVARVVRSYTEPAGSDDMEGALEQIENAAMADAGSMNPRVFKQPVRIAPAHPPRPARTSHPRPQQEESAQASQASQAAGPTLPATAKAVSSAAHSSRRKISSSSRPMLAASRQAQESPKRSSGLGLQPYDILLDRYRLTSLLKDEPGLSAWQVEDGALDRNSQLFIINDARAVKTVNAVASALALSSNQRFTKVYQLHTRDNISLVVTNLDSGLSVRSYLADPSTPAPSFEAIRTIIGESALALTALRKLSVSYLTLSSSLIRLSPSGVTLADTPILSMLEPWLQGPGSSKSGNEAMVVRQLSGVLYELLTGSEIGSGADDQQPSLQALAQDTPEEFRIICKRGLNLRAADGRPTVPLITLAELMALLGSWTPPAGLSARDIPWPQADPRSSAESVESVKLKPVAEQDLLPLPPTLVTARGKDQPYRRSTRWGTNQLLFPERSEIEMLNLGDSDADLFSLFEERRQQGGQPVKPRKVTAKRAEQPTQAVDVSAIRHPQLRSAAPLSADGQPPAATQALPLQAAATGPEGSDQADITVGQTAAIDRAKTAPAEPEAASQLPAAETPPSFSPPVGSSAAMRSYSDRAADTSDEGPADLVDDDVADARLFGRFTTRSVVMALAAGLVLLGLIWASATLLSHRQPKVTPSEFWPQTSASPSSGSTSGKGPADPAPSTGSKAASQVPSPHQPTNTTAYPTPQQVFVSHPANQDGMGWYIHLDAPHEVSRLEISIQQHSGQGQVFAHATAAQPTPGQPAADFSFDPSGTTSVRLKTPVTTQDLMIWVPTASLPQEGGLHFNDVKVY